MQALRRGKRRYLLSFCVRPVTKSREEDWTIVWDSCEREDAWVSKIDPECELCTGEATNASKKEERSRAEGEGSKQEIRVGRMYSTSIVHWARG